MPKLTDREKLIELEKRRRALEEEADIVRRNLRARYGAILADLPVERMTEKEFRDLAGQAIRTGGPAAIAALKSLPPAQS